MMDRFDSAQQPETSRELGLAQVADDHDQRQFGGRAPLYNRDVLAFLPFQVDDNRFVASVYVMTRDISAELAAAPYRLTVSNLRGDDVQASAYDPLTDQEVPVQVVSRSADRAVIEMPVSDSPRLLTLEDSGQPPTGGGRTETPPVSVAAAPQPSAPAAGTAPADSVSGLGVTSAAPRQGPHPGLGPRTGPVGSRLTVRFGFAGRKYALRAEASSRARPIRREAEAARRRDPGVGSGPSASSPAPATR